VAALVKLQKYLADAGIASRRAAEKMIDEGRVKVNGVFVKKLGARVDPSRDRVEVDNNPVQPPLNRHYYLLNKPKGYITTVSDPFNRPTVMDLFAGRSKRRLFPVGRLDRDTEGVLLVTDDGELAYRLTHPRYKVEKKYHVLVRGYPTAKDLDRLCGGVDLQDGGITAPAKARIISVNKEKDLSLLELTLYEGRKRQVKRMCTALGYGVVSLKRVSFAFLSAKGLKPGAFRPLERKEITRLYSLVGMNNVTSNNR